MSLQYTSFLSTLNASHLRPRLLSNTASWHENGLDRFWSVAETPLDRLIDGLHSCNQYSWYADDRSRAQAAPADIVQHKRDLDASNLMRSSFMEAIDAAAVRAFDLPVDPDLDALEINSETIGQMIDRISVQTLKHFYLERRVNQADAAPILHRVTQQLHYVGLCLDRFVNALQDGRAHMLAYRQYKTYDPNGR